MYMLLKNGYNGNSYSKFNHGNLGLKSTSQNGSWKSNVFRGARSFHYKYPKTNLRTRTWLIHIFRQLLSSLELKYPSHRI